MLEELQELQERAEKIKPLWEYLTEQICPAIIIFHRKTKSKTRKVFAGYETIESEKGKIMSDGKRYITKKIYKPFKKKKNRDMNNYSVATCFIDTMDDLGTIVRSMKHKAYKMVGVLPATDNEKEADNTTWRYKIRKFKNFEEFRLQRNVQDPEFNKLIETLERMHPCIATGQTKMFGELSIINQEKGEIDAKTGEIN